MMYAPPCVHQSLMNIFPLLLLVLFSFITDVRINIHILYHNILFPKRDTKVFYDFGNNEDQEWLIEEILAHKWTDRKSVV